MENNERSSDRRQRPAYDASEIRRAGVWKGNELWFRERPVAMIVRDSRYPQMWRVMINGELSDMVNRIRAKDAAYSLAAANA